MTTVHRESFSPASRPRAPQPVAIDETAVRKRHEAETLKGLSIFARSARAEARRLAGERAAGEIAEQRRVQESARAQFQAELDKEWNALLANDPDVVIATLAAAFEDNEAVAAPVGVSGDEASIVVVVPDSSAIPEKKPSVTAAGNPNLKKLTKAESAALYLELVAGFVVVTAKEALAVAPNLRSVRLVALRQGEPDAFGERQPEVLLGVSFDRDVLERVQWSEADASQVLHDAGGDLVIQIKGRPPVIQALELEEEPGLAAVVAAVDIGDLTD